MNIRYIILAGRKHRRSTDREYDPYKNRCRNHCTGYAQHDLGLYLDAPCFILKEPQKAGARRGQWRILFLAAHQVQILFKRLNTFRWLSEQALCLFQDPKVAFEEVGLLLLS